MQFVSVPFLLFAAALVLVYYTVPRAWQPRVLLAASALFYLEAGLPAFALIAFTSLSTYFAARLIDANNARQKRILSGECGVPVSENGRIALRDENAAGEEDRLSPKAVKERVKAQNARITTLCLVLNFAILAVCKSCLLQPVAEIAKTGRLSFLTVGLPMGISFYMFQSTGYLIDVNRGTVKAEKSLADYALFVAYFPQLIQGPISSFSDLAPQFKAPHEFNAKSLSFGAQRMLWGYFKKLVVADRIAAAVLALKAPEYTGLSFLVLTVFYAVQIYGDFTGGIDIVIGLSEMLGITLKENFVRPYFSKNIAEYWRRWHISLGEWMKKYIFYPISVSGLMRRVSKAARGRLGAFGKRVPVYAASFATWFVTGIWHGLTPNFILWGMLNCIVIVTSEELTPLYAKFHARFHLKEKRWYGVFEILRMFCLMNLIRVVDLFPDVSEYFRRLGTMFSSFSVPFLELGLTGLDYGILAAAVVLMLAVGLVQEKRGSVREVLWGIHPACRRALLFALFTVVLLMGSYGIGYNAGSFIYNQF